MPPAGLSSYPKAPSRSESRSSGKVSSKANSVTAGDEIPVGTVADASRGDGPRGRSNSPKRQVTLPDRTVGTRRKDKRAHRGLRQASEDEE